MLSLKIYKHPIDPWTDLQNLTGEFRYRVPQRHLISSYQGIKGLMTLGLWSNIDTNGPLKKILHKK